MLAPVMDFDRPTPPQLAGKIRSWVEEELGATPPPGEWTFAHQQRPHLLLTLSLAADGRWVALAADNARSLATLSKTGLVLAAAGWGSGIRSGAGWDELSRLVGATTRPNGAAIAGLRRTLEVLSWPLIWSAVVTSDADWARERLGPWFYATPNADASHPAELTPSTVLGRQLAAGGWIGATDERMRTAGSDAVRRLLAYASIATRRPIAADGVVRTRLSLVACAEIIGAKDVRPRRLRSSLAGATEELGRLAPEHAGSRLDGDSVELLRVSY